ncbi:hypothetical protein [Piscinibacter sp.]|jgi:hypothetical protein|uniref:hypothetical protein n=1 Tax=Piscinibacter sp. TaxID=1903157 RepID=UPI00355A253C
MALYEFTDDTRLVRVEPQKFSELMILERTHLQRALREAIDAITPGVITMVLTEEFGEWKDANRRIDLLCLDSDGHLVVVELKRTESAGHADLQALRYAAMVAPMTFDQAVTAHAKYLAVVGQDPTTAENSIRTFLDQESGSVAFKTEVRIVLAAGDFDPEITTSVLWLNSMGLDIRCVQMQPHLVGTRRILDIKQLIPLPEAAHYQVAIREKSREQVAAQEGAYRDFTKYDLLVDGTSYPRLPKRRFIYFIVRAAIDRGMTPEDVATCVPWRTMAAMFLNASGELTSAMFAEANADRDIPRWFADDSELFHSGGRTYALTKMWGEHTEKAVKAILEALPDKQGITYTVSVGA